jgi:hypothetical protein
VITNICNDMLALLVGYASRASAAQFVLVIGLMAA